MFTVDDPEPLLYHDEPVFRNGKMVSANTHGAYGHQIGHSIGMFYLENPEGITEKWILEGRYEAEIEGRMFPISVHLKAPYDPGGERVRA